MKWHDSNPYGNTNSFIKKSRWDVHRFGRQQFASNFAQGGLSATLFAATPGDAFRNVLSSTAPKGSPKHIRNLTALAQKYPDNPNIMGALNKAKSAGYKPASFKSKAVGHALVGGFVASTFFTTPGGLAEKTKATVSEGIGFLGWKPGMAIGAAIGSSILPVIGTGIGMLAGGLMGQIGLSTAVDYGFKRMDNMVESERRRRHLNWVGDKTQFNTQGAYTMRQQSMAAMNRGMSTARSALGREAIMVHQ